MSAMKFSLANLQHALARLAPRERLFVTAGVGVFAAFLVFFVIYKTQQAKGALREKIAGKQRQLEKVQALRTSYLELKRQTDALTSHEATRETNWLYSMLDGLVAKTVSREKVQAMAPSVTKIGDQYVEESVNVQLLGVTLQQTVGLLHEIEQSPTPLHVSRLQMKKRPADPYQFDLTFAVSSIKAATG
jgi:general secretion pathway protein M